ncbi:MAG: hypothetical protein EPN84_06895 [Legionella sp.]|nr:MAG: hypothetical protein EPN84_06895 [Legionella sp.]
MKKPLFIKSTPIFCIALLMPILTSNSAFALATDGKMVNPKISTKKIVLQGGNNLTAKWTVPAISTYKVWIQIPSGSTASDVIYYVYPKGNSVANKACSSSDSTYPCFKATVNQFAASSNEWVQLTLNNDANTSWEFSKSGYVSVKANGISTTQQFGVAQVSFEDASNSLTIGQIYQGGIITYLDSTNLHGLIAAPQDQKDQQRWYNGSFITTGAIGKAIGTGQANTTAIVEAQGAGNYAAKACDDLVLGIYSDWYLPSLYELNQLFFNKIIIDLNHWSSTENSNYSAFPQGGSPIYQDSYPYDKNWFWPVRCIRTF